MTCRGIVKGGTIVLDEPAALPEGSRVECVIREIGSDGVEASHKPVPMYQDLLEFAGRATGLPEDASGNVDPYLHGHPKE